MNAELIQKAVGELGVKESKGKADNPIILNYAKEAGFSNIGNDETPWCSIFLNWCCATLDLPRSESALARSWLNVGKPITNPIPGDIVIFWRESPSSWKGHVGLFMGFSENASTIFCLGGNQKDSVSIQGYRSNQLLGFRRVSRKKIPIPKPDLVHGNVGQEVKKLQTLLNEFNHNAGTADGVFGPKTKAALIGLQKSLGLEKSKGEYNTSTETKLRQILLG